MIHDHNMRSVKATITLLLAEMQRKSPESRVKLTFLQLKDKYKWLVSSSMQSPFRKLRNLDTN